jgi:hypothetical protein
MVEAKVLKMNSGNVNIGKRRRGEEGWGEEEG